MIKNDELLFPAGAEISVIPVLQGEGLPKIDESELPETIPILALRNVVLFPGTIYPITIGREKSKRLIADAEKHGTFIGAVPQLDVNVEEPGEEDLYRFGTVAKVIKTLDMPDGTVTAILQSIKRIELLTVVDYDPYIKGIVRYLDDIITKENSTDLKGIASTIKDKASQIMANSNMAAKEAIGAMRSIDNFPFLVNFIATTVDVENFEGKIDLLQYDDVKARAMKLLVILDGQLQLTNLKQEINLKVKQEIDQQQREYYLNNQLRTIQEELGMDGDEEFERFRERAAAKNWPESVAKTFEKELSKLEKYNPNSPDYSVQYNYIEFMLDLPWGDMSKDNLDLKHAKKVLDEDHFGLDTIKDRIIEYLAVLKLKVNMKSPILCHYGPPGVGKTSLGKSIARALGRKYVRIALGGMHDEAEIRGHRKTYVGALPGRILNGINKAGTSNPVIVLDEIDKLSSDFKGDPSSALLEALDPEQNGSFHDNYLDIDYDLSNVLFITTANSISPMQPALLDRMEIINVSGYLAEEKMEIAARHLIPKQIEAHGLTKGSVRFQKKALQQLIESYTRESGVRELDKKIAKVIRKLACKYAEGEEIPAVIKEEDLATYLGTVEYTRDKYQGNDYAGVVTGLAWTAVGGEILFVESSLSKGKGLKLTLTGNLGDVMKESAVLALEYVHAHADLFQIDESLFENYNVHVHVPEGAIPKDGPSAGVTMVTSLVSLFTQRKVKSNLAMTGEITLRGKVLPVGGIKEKILAAKRAGITEIILCKANQKDIDEIQPAYLKGLSFHYVEDIQQVIAEALLPEKVQHPLF